MSSPAPRAAGAAREPARRAAPRQAIGAWLRAARLEQQVGVRELARRIGVSASLISQIEAGKVGPSVGTLSAIATELRVSVNDVLLDSDEPPAPEPAAVHDVAHGPESRLLGPGGLWSAGVGHGLTRYVLAATGDPAVDFVHVVCDPARPAATGAPLERHAGREYGVVLSGRLRVSVGSEEHELGPGDSISFDASAPHRLAAAGDEPAEAVWFVVGRRLELASDC